MMDGVVTKASGAASFGVSATGTLVYIQGRGTERQTLAWIDRMGTEEPLGIEPRLVDSPALSPDGTRVAMTIVANDGTDRDIWVWSLTRRTLTRLTVEPGLQDFPLWTPDGTRIAYRSVASSRGAPPAGAGIYWRPADGTGTPDLLLLRRPNTSSLLPTSWANGRLVVDELLSGGTRDLSVLDVAGDRAVTPLLANPTVREASASVSRDGRWIAYQSNETGQEEIYVRPFPNVEDGKWQVSSGGGLDPRWSADGGSLFYRNTSGLMRTSIQIVPTFSSSTPMPAIGREVRIGSGASSVARQYDVSADGLRVLVMKDGDDTAERPDLNVVLNWFEELKRLVPTN